MQPIDTNSHLLVFKSFTLVVEQNDRHTAEMRARINRLSIEFFITSPESRIIDAPAVDALLARLNIVDLPDSQALIQIQRVWTDRLQGIRQGVVAYRDLSPEQSRQINFIEAALLADPACWRELPSFFQTNEDFIRRSLTHQPKIFPYLSSDMQRNPEIAKIAVRFASELYTTLPAHLQAHPAIVEELVRTRADLWSLTPREIFDSLPMTIAAIHKNPRVVFHANPRFQPELKPLALMRSGGLYLMLSPQEQRELIYIKAALSSSPLVWQWLPDDLLHSADAQKIAFQAIESNPETFIHFDENLRSIKPLAWLAVTHRPQNWLFLPISLQSDAVFTQSLIEGNPDVYLVLLDSFKSQHAEYILSSHPHLSDHIPETFWLDAIRKERFDHFGKLCSSHPAFTPIFEKALERHPHVWRLLSDALRAEKALTERALIRNPSVLFFLSAEECLHAVREIAEILRLSAMGVLPSTFIETIATATPIQKALVDAYSPRIIDALQSAYQINQMGSSAEQQVMALAFIEIYPDRFFYLKTELRRDPELMIRAAQRAPNLWQYADDSDATLKAAAQRELRAHPGVFRFFPKSWLSDRDMISTALAHHAENWVYIPSALRSQLSFLIEMCGENPSIYHFLSAEHQADPQIMNALLSKTIDHWRMIPREIQTNRQVLIKLIALNPHLFQLLEDPLNHDISLIQEIIKAHPSIALELDDLAALELVSRDGLNLKNLSTSHKKFEPVVRTALMSNPAAINEVDEELVCRLLTENGSLFNHLVDEKKIWKYLAAAVISFPKALLSSSENLQRGFVTANPEYLLHCADALQQDPSFAIGCWMNRPSLFPSLLQQHRSNHHFLLAAMEKAGYLIESLPSEYLNDEALWHVALKLSPQSIRLLPAALMNREVLIRLMASNPILFSYIEAPFCHERDLILQAIKLDPSNFDLVHSSLIDDEMIAITLPTHLLNWSALPERWRTHEGALRCLDLNPQMITMLPMTYKLHPDCIRRSLELSGEVYRFLPDDRRRCLTTTLQALSRNGLLLQFVPGDLKNHPDVIRTALMKNGRALRYAPAVFRNQIEFCKIAAMNDPTAIAYFGTFSQEVLIQLIYEIPHLTPFGMSASLSQISGKRYAASPIPDHLRLRRKLDEPVSALISRLDALLSSFITDWTPADLARIHQSLEGLSFTTLEEAKLHFHQARTTLIRRVTDCQPYFGTPSASNPAQVQLFYQGLTHELGHITLFLERTPDSFMEKLILMDAQRFCGSRFKSEVSQLFSRIAFDASSLSLAQRLALILSSEAKKTIGAIVAGIPQWDVHHLSTLHHQLARYIADQTEVQDQIGHLFEPRQLQHYFLTSYNANHLVSILQEALKQDEELDELMMVHLMHDRAPSVSFYDRMEIFYELSAAWEVSLDSRRTHFIRYLEAKAHQGSIGRVLQSRTDLQTEHDRNLFLRRFFPTICEATAACRSIEEFESQLPALKERFIGNSMEKTLESRKRQTLRERCCDDEGRWTKQTIAQVLEQLKLFIGSPMIRVE